MPPSQHQTPMVTKRRPRSPLSTAEPSLVVPKPTATTEVPGASVRSLAGSCTAALEEAESSSSSAICAGEGGQYNMILQDLGTPLTAGEAAEAPTVGHAPRGGAEGRGQHRPLTSLADVDCTYCGCSAAATALRTSYPVSAAAVKERPMCTCSAQGGVTTGRVRGCVGMGSCCWASIAGALGEP